MRRRLALIVIPLAAVASLSVMTSASAAPSSTATVLRGAAEVPGPGDADGFGRAVVSIRPDVRTVCVNIRYRNIDAPTGAHIHEGAPDVAGPVVIDFTPLIATSPAGSISGCVRVAPALARDVAANPSDYYVNVHNVVYPAGAIRGQLS